MEFRSNPNPNPEWFHPSIEIRVTRNSTRNSTRGFCSLCLGSFVVHIWVWPPWAINRRLNTSRCPCLLPTTRNMSDVRTTLSGSVSIFNIYRRLRSFCSRISSLALSDDCNTWTFFCLQPSTTSTEYFATRILSFSVERYVLPWAGLRLFSDQIPVADLQGLRPGRSSMDWRRRYFIVVDDDLIQYLLIESAP